MTRTMVFKMRLLWLICLLASTYASLRMLYAILVNTERAWVLRVAHDQLLNASNGGDPDETWNGSDQAAAILDRRELVLIWLACLLIEMYAAIAMWIAIKRDPARAWLIAVSHDQLANAAANGKRTETISSRADRGRTERSRWGCLLCRFLDSIDPDHCRRARGV